MPSGPSELHEKWQDDNKACKYLQDRGYRLTREWQWNLPHSQYKPTKEEMEAMYYLVVEWDYGGYSNEAKTELDRQEKRSFWCKIGLHRFAPALNELGPRVAIEMNDRSGALVMLYHGPWKTCIKCGHQHFVGQIPEQ